MIIDQRERARRRRLAKAHMDAENAHDLDAIMRTFAPHAIGQVNDDVATTPEQIAQVHAQYGLSAAPGILTDLQVIADQEHFTDEEIVYEGHFLGRHTGAAPGYPPPSGLEVRIPYIVLYRFDAAGLLVSERARLDLSPLLQGLVPPTAAAGSTP